MKFLANARAFQFFCCSLLLLAIIALFQATTSATDGLLIYTLDDIYIHLSVAETILQGGYGINSAEFASPSSSILFPFLLAATTFIGLDDFGPLLLTVLPSICSMWIVSGLFWESLRARFGPWSPVAFFLLPPVLIFAVNGIALPFTGMEHSLHVLSVCMLMLGIYRLNRGEGGLWLAVAGTFLTGTIRFEGLALAAAGIFALFWLRRRKASFAVAFVMLLVLGAYFIFMSRLGLPFLPSSVLSKSGIAGTLDESGLIDALKGFRYTFERSLDDRSGLLIALGGVFLFAELFRKNTGTAKAVVALAVVSIAGHLLAGRYGWFERYEVYVIVAMLIGLLVVDRGHDSKPSGFTSFAKVFGFLAVVASPFVFITLKVPAAAQNIYEQQFQMHRFTTGYFPYPVAVNDLGWVSYKNDNYVLDLWGLGSEKARIASRDGLSGAETGQLAEEKGVAFAMLYDFFAVPETWCEIARLNTSQVVTPSGTVVFYVVDPSLTEEMSDALYSFSETLPRNSKLTINACP